MPNVREVIVELGERSYPVRVGTDLLATAGEVVAGLGNVSSVILVTNPRVGDLYQATLERSLDDAGLTERTVVRIPDGEPFKSIQTVEAIYDAALGDRADRGSVVLALGGGVVGDAAGFAAATLLRGIRLVMVPTTLLAQVDSSVGGKTGVNRAHGKNLVGAFHQSSAVLSDMDTLKTLDEREYRAGLAEVIKYGVIVDAPLFQFLEDRVDSIIALESETVGEIVARSVEIKADVVAKDERESGLRAILNFGHTVGHAVEQATGYERYLHGEAVALGMIAALRLSANLGACSADAEPRLGSLLKKFGLETEIPDDIDRGDLLSAMSVDKKVRGDSLNFVVSLGIGDCELRALSLDDVKTALEW